MDTSYWFPGAALSLLLATAAWAYPPPPPDPSVPASDVPPAVQQLRRAMRRQLDERP